MLLASRTTYKTSTFIIVSEFAFVFGGIAILLTRIKYFLSSPAVIHEHYLVWY